MNACIRYALTLAKENDYVYTLNNDTELAPDCIEKLVNFASIDPKVIVGTLNLFYDNRERIEPSAFFNKKFLIFYYNKRLFSFGQTIPEKVENYYPVDTLSGKGILFPIEVFKVSGLLNEKVLPHYHRIRNLLIEVKGWDIQPERYIERPTLFTRK